VEKFFALGVFSVSNLKTYVPRLGIYVSRLGTCVSGLGI
jgi:hypothetical protein